MISTLHKYKTEFNADSVEWCPHKPFQNYFVCANYQLSDSKNGENSSKRYGRILLFSVLKEEGLTLHQTIETDGILDQKWCHNKIDECSILGVATSNKKIQIYKLNLELVQLEFITEIQFDSPNSDLLILSLDWSTGKFHSNEPEIICSDSKGDIHRLRFNNNKLSLINEWNAHSYEAWIAAFDYWHINITFTGGDDGLLRMYDQRNGSEPIATNKKAEAGVTSIHSNIKKENVFATGSYDTYLRLWDARTLKSSIKDVKMPGPVWRIKWDPFEATQILAACMLEGVHIVDLNSYEIVANYLEHKDISYGIDWSYLSKNELEKLNITGDCITASCSFYDNLLCVSNYLNINN